MWTEGGGRGGKRGILLDIVDRYWDEIIGDFRKYFGGLDAGEWLRVRLFPHSEEEVSRYTWGDFLRLVVYCTNEHGSALFDSSLGDKDVIDELYRTALEEQSKKLKPKDEGEYHPSRRGYTREVEATLEVADNVIALRAEMGKWKGSSTRFTPKPLFPAEAVQNRLKNRNRAIRDDRVAAAQARWSKRQ